MKCLARTGAGFQWEERGKERRWRTNAVNASPDRAGMRGGPPSAEKRRNDKESQVEHYKMRTGVKNKTRAPWSLEPPPSCRKENKKKSQVLK